jgi:hypothetical protein
MSNVKTKQLFELAGGLGGGGGRKYSEIHIKNRVY